MAKEGIQRKKKKRRKKNYLLRLIIFIAVCAGVYFLMSTSFFDIDKISVEGNSYYTAQQIADKAKIKNGSNIFFEINASKVKTRLLADPYIKNTKIARRPPSTVMIKVEERKEAAAVTYGTSFFIIDKEGIILKKIESEPKVTLISGIIIKNAEVGKPLEAEENYVLTDTLQMIDAMDESALYFKKIEISSVMVNAYINDQFVCRGTPEALMENIKNGNLHQVLYKQYEQGIERGMITVGPDGYCSFNAEIQ